MRKLKILVSCFFIFLVVTTSFGFAQTSENGLGFFRPDYINLAVHKFYPQPNGDQLISELKPMDSLFIMHGNYGMFDVKAAPPWFMPEHMKLDYGILYLTVLSVGKDYVEVVVNKQTGQTAYMEKGNGDLLYWPEFLLIVNSVEFPDGSEQKVHIKALLSSSEVNQPYAFMKPLLIRDEWMKVELMNENFESVGQGWIQWKKDGKLLITYSLLS